LFVSSAVSPELAMPSKETLVSDMDTVVEGIGRRSICRGAVDNNTGCLTRQAISFLHKPGFRHVARASQVIVFTT
jgi:hypothetical protein